MATSSASESPPKKLMWDNPAFSKMYTAAEKFTGWYGEILIKQSGILNHTFQNDSDKLTVLDDACGTGIITGRLLKLLSASAKDRLDLMCMDLADSMVEFTRQRTEKEGWKGVKVTSGDAMDTKFPPSSFNYVFFNFGPFLLPQPSAGIREIHRMLTPNGIMGITCWEQVGWMGDVRSAFATNPSLPTFPSDETLRAAFSKDPARWDNKEDVTDHLIKHGFVDVEVNSIPMTSRLDSVDEFIGLMPGTLGMIFGNFWTDQQRKEKEEEAKNTVVEWFRNTYGEKGPIEWHWKAIVATGRKPE